MDTNLNLTEKDEHMKRLMSILGALALVAGFFMAAPAANAAVTCQNVPSSLTVWPYAPNGSTPAAAQYCGTATTQTGAGMAGVLYGFSFHAPDAYSKFASYSNSGFAGTPRQFFVFGNYDEYVSFFDAKYGGHVTPLTDPYLFPGFTVKDGTTGAPEYTVVFQQIHIGGVFRDQPYFQNTVAHEAGHWMDYFYRTVMSGTTNASGSAGWSTLVNYDWDHTNNTLGNPYPIGVNQHHNCTSNPV